MQVYIKSTPRAGMSTNGRFLTAKKWRAALGLPATLLKQGLCCFDRLERQGDNGLEHVVFVMGADGSIVAIRCGLDTF